MLTEGAVVERLKNECKVSLDKFINHAGLIYSESNELAAIYNEYIAVAQKQNLPIMLMTPTRKVTKETLKLSAFSNNNVILDSCSFLKKIRAEHNNFSDKIYIGGLLGCKGDAYSGAKVFSVDKSYTFHSEQVKVFKEGEVDFLFAGIMPQITEATGLALAMETSNIPYIISFMINKNGCLLDGTNLFEAINIIDSATKYEPLGYMVNCIHPLILNSTLQVNHPLKGKLLNRFLGIQANASSLSPEELNNSSVYHHGNFDLMVNEILELTLQYNLKILGGCCGTDSIFLDMLADRLKKT